MGKDIDRDMNWLKNVCKQTTMVWKRTYYKLNNERAKGILNDVENLTGETR